jgi:hypothetical protein
LGRPGKKYFKPAKSAGFRCYTTKLSIVDSLLRVAVVSGGISLCKAFWP